MKSLEEIVVLKRHFEETKLIKKTSKNNDIFLRTISSHQACGMS